MPRLLFEKTGNAIWISHLDLMRLFQRSFKRAGIHLKHSQGFNPRPYVALALPLSVGVESHCELLDFDLEGEGMTSGQIQEALNQCLVSGIRVLDVYESGKKIRDLALLRCTVMLEYDAGVPTGAVEEVKALFSRETLLVDKKGKNGITQQDIIPMIKSLDVMQADAYTLKLQGVVCCQNPTLNPMQMAAAINRYLPNLKPDFAKCCREEIYDQNERVFR